MQGIEVSYANLIPLRAIPYFSKIEGSDVDIEPLKAQNLI